MMERLDTPELLDEHDAEPKAMERSLRDLQRFNRWCGGTRVYRKIVRRLLNNCEHPLVIDLGAGTADLVDSLGGNGIAVDWNLRHLLYQRHTSHARRVVADVRRLPFCDNAADAVTSSHFFHHFTPEENMEILRESLRVARVGVAMTDTRRHLAPLLFTLLLRWLRLVGRITAFDAPASIRRGYTTSETRAIAERTGAKQLAVDNYVPLRWGMLLWK
ncbi:MAG TPA: methyltransferase domain-containing protein [Thermoanaerobaculia bacterium]|nr:methyltransferase domain-containing protein [Thermoanaerobaculia bacterium]